MQGNDKPNNDIRNQIIVGDQVGMTEETQKKKFKNKKTQTIDGYRPS